MERPPMGELIQFRKGPEGVWSDAGEPPVEEPPPEPGRPRLLALPVLLFLDALALVLALACRPVPATVLVLAGGALWSAFRALIGLGHGGALLLGLLCWVVAALFGHDVDGLVKAVETAESAALRRAYRASRVGGRALHVALYLYSALAPGVLIAWASGLLRGPAWLPAVVRPDGLVGHDHPAAVLLAGLLLGAAAVATRYRWHPVARHATLLGAPRKFAVVG